MIIYVIIIFLLLLIPCRLRIAGFNEDYISKDSCNVIKGLFILLILTSHFCNNYLKGDLTAVDSIYRQLRVFLGQSVVTMFFFYSGFGVTESVKAKGFSYIRSMPRKRILRTLLIFDLSVIIFLIYYIVLIPFGHPFHTSVSRLIRQFLSLSRIGNDNWYIFDILCLYCFSFISFRAYHENEEDRSKAVVWITGFSIALMYAVKAMGWQSCWYNTLLCYPLGCWYSLFREQAERLLKKNHIYFPALLLAALCYRFFHIYWNEGTSFYVITMLAFAVMILLVTMKFSSRNAVLGYCGRHLNSIFLIHRLPMMALALTPVRNNIYVHFGLSLILTFILAFLFEKLTDLIGGVFSGCLRKSNNTDSCLKSS